MCFYGVLTLFLLCVRMPCSSYWFKVLGAKMFILLRFLFTSFLSPPHRSPRTPSVLAPPVTPLSHVLLPSLSLSLNSLRHSWTPYSLRSMGHPWISPGSPHSPMDTHLWVLPCFSSFVSHSSPNPCFPVTMRSLILLLSLIPCITIDFSFPLTHLPFVIVLLSYSLNFPMTHSHDS